MTTTPTICTLGTNYFIGFQGEFSLAEEHGKELWMQLMPRRSEIKQMLDTSLYSIAFYDQHYFDHFDPQRPFERWAAVHVAEDSPLPEGMKKVCVPSGQYAKFTHVGPIAQVQSTFEYIFYDWLPESPYAMDDRPHIAEMDGRYKPFEKDSEEDLYIPIKKKD